MPNLYKDLLRFCSFAQHMCNNPFFHQKNSSDIMQCSVLGHILPEAMVCYLENYESEKFAEIFLGEFDTPEAIWNTEMR